MFTRATAALWTDFRVVLSFFILFEENALEGLPPLLDDAKLFTISSRMLCPHTLTA